MAIKNIVFLYELRNNPFALTRVILSFLSEYQSHKRDYCDILILYLVFPLSLYPESQKLLTHVNIKSRISKFSENQESLAGLAERMEQFYVLTNQCIQHALNNRLIEIDGTKIKLKVSRSGKNNSIDEQCAKNLAKIFSKYETLEIYRLLGVRQLCAHI